MPPRLPAGGGPGPERRGAPSGRRSWAGLVEQVESQQAEKHRTDEADLETPPEVLRSRPEEPEQRHRGGSHPNVDARPPAQAPRQVHDT